MGSTSFTPALLQDVDLCHLGGLLQTRTCPLTTNYINHSPPCTILASPFSSLCKEQGEEERMFSLSRSGFINESDRLMKSPGHQQIYVEHLHISKSNVKCVSQTFKLLELHFQTSTLRKYQKSAEGYISRILINVVFTTTRRKKISERNLNAQPQINK